MTPKLSVVIPCYNMGGFVQDAIASVLAYPNQEDLELIIVNDGSNDDGFTKAILDAYTLPNLRVIHQDNKGLGHARNTGIALAKAPYIIPLDADNMVRTAYITHGISILNTNPDVGLVYGDLIRFGTEDGVVQVGELHIAKLLKKNYIDACVVLRKSAWASIGGYDEHMPVMGYEDWDLHLRLFFKGWHFSYVNETLFDYRVRDDSMLAHSNAKRALLLDYMFHKPELQQAGIIRSELIHYDSVLQELEHLKKRKVIHTALKVEQQIKKHNRIHRFLKAVAALFKA